MSEHKHASVLRAIADGVPLSEFEITSSGWIGKSWDCLHGYATWLKDPDEYEIRRKPQHIIVNGFKVPKPLDVLPSVGVVYIASTDGESFYSACETSYPWAKKTFDRGITHATKGAAIAHAMAMLGIDPKWEE